MARNQLLQHTDHGGKRRVRYGANDAAGVLGEQSLFFTTATGILDLLEPESDVPAAPDIPFREFIGQAWPHIEPKPLIPNWHLDAISEHLEAFAKGQIQDLIINQPPRTTKSLTCSVMFPAWEWTFRSTTRFLFASYGQPLSNRDSLRTRRLIRDPWYQSHWHDRFQITEDKDTLSRFENDHGGFRIATSVGGVSTGEGADVIFIDDPLKAEQAESEIARNRVNIWFSETMTTRRDDQRTGRRGLVMQRLHENDLSGYWIREGGSSIVLLKLPMEYEVFRDHTGVELPKPKTAIGWEDPRTEEGEILDPIRFTLGVLEKMRHDMGEYSYAGQMQQRPAPRGGGMLKRANFEIVAQAPKWLTMVRYWDKAASSTSRSARTCGCLMGRDPITGIFYIVDIKKGRWEIDERDAVMRDVTAQDGHGVTVWQEQEPGSGGKESAIATGRMLAGYVVFIDRVTGDKVTRAQPLASQAAIGNVKLVQAEWNEEFLAEVEVFPFGRYKDQVDSSAGALVKLADLMPFQGVSAGGRERPDVR